MVTVLKGRGGSYAGRTVAISTRVIPSGVSGVVAQLRSDLDGSLAWSKLSGASTIAIATAGAVSLSTPLGEGVSVTFRARVQNGVGDAFERELTLQTQATALMSDGPAPPTIAFAASTASITEGNSGTQTVTNTINVTRNGVTGALVMNLNYGGTATAGSDYVAGPSSVTIASGADSASFDLTINGDTTVEADETIVINAALAAYSSSTASKTITIANDDSAGIPAPTISLSSAVSQAEGNSGTTAFVWTLTLNRDGSTASLPYTWAVTGVTADAADFGGTFPSGSGTFSPGETSKTITVLAAGDTAVEPNETFTLSATLTGFNTVTSTGTISNDDAASDTTPNAFTFTDVTNATVSTDYTSNTITVAGIDAPSPISITGGTYSKNGGAFTSTSGTVVNGDTVAVKGTSSGSASTAVNVVLTIGGVSDTYTVTTAAAAVAPTASLLARAPTADDDRLQGYSADGAISYLEVKTAGVGSVVPTLTIAPPPAGGVQATAHLVQTGAGMSLAVIDNPGRGYTSNPAVTLSGGTYTTAPVVVAHYTPNGSSWINSATGEVYRCTSAASGAAVWALQSAPSAYPLDALTSPITQLAVSFRRLTAAYSSTGPCADVYRASDGAMQTINFAGDTIDVTALTSFLSGTTGTVSKLYDQSGAGNHAVQDTAANRPAIDFNWTIGGLPTFYGGLFNLPAGVSVPSQGGTDYCLTRAGSTSANRVLMKAGQLQIGYSNLKFSVTANGTKALTVPYDSPTNAELIGATVVSATDATVMLGEQELHCTSGCAGALVSGTGGTIGTATVAQSFGAGAMFVALARSLSASERFAFKAAVNLAFGVLPQIRDTIILSGDSRPSGSGATNLFGTGPQTLALLTIPARIINVSTGGANTADRVADFWAKDARAAATSPHRRLAVVSWVGVNDSNLSLTGQQSYDNFTEYTRLAKSIGAKVVLATDPLISTKVAFNPLVVANTAGADAIADYNAGAPAPATYPHYSLAQYAYFAGVNATVLNPLLAAAGIATPASFVGTGTGVVTGPAYDTLTLDNPNATAGTAWSSTFSGTPQSGYTVTATSDDGTVLTVSGNTVSGTFPTAKSVVVQITEKLGSNGHTTDNAVVVGAGAGVTVPVNTALPTITPMTGVATGTVLNIADYGAFSGGGTITFAWRWYKGTNPISAGNGGTALTYTVGSVAGDVGSKFRLQVIPTNAAGPGAPAYSAYTNTVAA